MKIEPKVNKFHLMTKSEVCVLLSISPATLWRMCSPTTNSYLPDFPAPVKIGTRCSRFRSDEILNWVKSLERGLYEQEVSQWESEP